MNIPWWTWPVALVVSVAIGSVGGTISNRIRDRSLFRNCWMCGKLRFVLPLDGTTRQLSVQR